MTPEQIARVCHEANRGYQAAVPTPEIPVASPWDDFPADQQEGVIRGVQSAIEGAEPEELHELWCVDKASNGWVHGPAKDTVGKTHPCLVPYAELPEAQRIKDRLFMAIVLALHDEKQPRQTTADIKREPETSPAQRVAHKLYGEFMKRGMIGGGR